MTLNGFPLFRLITMVDKKIWLRRGTNFMWWFSHKLPDHFCFYLKLERTVHSIVKTTLALLKVTHYNMYPTNNADKEEKDLRWEFVKENKNSTKKKRKNFIFFLITFLVEFLFFLFSYFLVSFYKFPPQMRSGLRVLFLWTSNAERFNHNFKDQWKKRCSHKKYIKI